MMRQTQIRDNQSMLQNIRDRVMANTSLNMQDSKHLKRSQMFYDILPVFFFGRTDRECQNTWPKIFQKKYLSICETCQNMSQVKIILKKTNKSYVRTNMRSFVVGYVDYNAGIDCR